MAVNVKHSLDIPRGSPCIQVTDAHASHGARGSYICILNHIILLTHRVNNNPELFIQTPVQHNGGIHHLIIYVSKALI